MSHDISPFLLRRERLAATMRAEGGGVAVIASAATRLRNGDTEYRYRFDSNFYYLTGFSEPDAILVLVADDNETRSILFCRDKNPELEIWEGQRLGPAIARERFGMDSAFPIAVFDERFELKLANRASVFCLLGRDRDFDNRIVRAIDSVRERASKGISAPRAVRDLQQLLDEMRLFKDASELASMRRATDIACAAHQRAMRFVRPGHFEYQVEAELVHQFMMAGADAPAYPSIVAGGANACTLHHIENRGYLSDGELVLVDAGCEVDGYASDITRSFPVNGRFSGPQRALYEVVLAAQEAAIAAVQPGASYGAGHDAAVRVLATGMVDLALLNGSVDGIIESAAYKRFYMHSTGHWLGLDVHDVGHYKLAGEWRPLAPGQVLTVEPGLYVRPAADVPEAFWNIGIRIEDDVLVTPEGYEILSAAAPKQIAAIETLMSDGRS